MDQGEMIGLEGYPNFRLQGNWGFYTVWQRTAVSAAIGQPDTWVELPPRFETKEAALSFVETLTAELAHSATPIPTAAE